MLDDDKVLLSKSGNGGITEFIDGQGIDEHLGEVTSAAARSYVTDQLGSVLNTQASSDQKIFGAFGDRLAGNANQEALDLDLNSRQVIYGFAGRESDLESGLYYNRARMYNTEMGIPLAK